MRPTSFRVFAKNLALPSLMRLQAPAVVPPWSG